MYINAIGHFHPDNQIDNSFFSELNNGSDADWVLERTGIKSRRSVLTPQDILDLRFEKTTVQKLRDEGKFVTIAEMSKLAWKQLLRGGHPIAEIDFLICGTSVPDFDIPANATTIGSAIAPKAVCVDINSACSSFVVDLHFARSLLLAGMAKNVAVVNPERYSVRLDYSDRSSSVLFGDGCTACVVSDQPGHNSFEILDTIVECCPEKNDVVQIPVGHHFKQIGRSVQKFAVSKTIEITEAILKNNDLTIDDLTYFIAHQANLRMLQSAVSRLGLPNGKHLFNVDEFGNQGAAGAPSVLSMNMSRFQAGDLIVVSVVGSGLTWASALLRKI